MTCATGQAPLALCHWRCRWPWLPAQARC